MHVTTNHRVEVACRVGGKDTDGVSLRNNIIARNMAIGEWCLLDTVASSITRLQWLSSGFLFFSPSSRLKSR